MTSQAERENASLREEIVQLQLVRSHRVRLQRCGAALRRGDLGCLCERKGGSGDGRGIRETAKEEIHGETGERKRDRAREKEREREKEGRGTWRKRERGRGRKKHRGRGRKKHRGGIGARGQH